MANNRDPHDRFSWTKISDSELCEKAEGGDVLMVLVRPRSAGRAITVRMAVMAVTIEKIVESEVTRACRFAHLASYPTSGLPAGY